MKYSSKHFEITERFWDGKKKIKERDENGKEIEKTIQLYFDDDRHEGKKEAIARAVVDLMARTLTPTGAEGKFSEEVVEPLLTKLADWFVPRDQITEKDFDEWHHDACKTVLGILNKYYSNDKEGTVPVQYGKAQKIVNMTMKGLYCLQGSEQYEAHFAYCHIALDSFTLEWFKREVILTYEECYKNWIQTLQKAAYETEQGSTWLQNRGKKQKATFMRECFSNKALKTEQNQLVKNLRERLESPKTPVKKCPAAIPERYFSQMLEEELRKMESGGYFPAELTAGRMLSWSVLPQQGGFHYGYDEYVRWIRVYFANNKDTEKPCPLTPFQAEFYIWPEIQLHMAAEAFYGQDAGSDAAVEYMLKYLKEIGDPDKQTEKIENAKDPFDACITLFKKLPLSQKMKFLEDRIKEMRALYPEDVAAAV